MTSRHLAPAKLTRSLAIVGLRSDGYHLLESEMLSVSLADTVAITEGGHGTTVHAHPGSRAEILDGGGENLCDAALRLIDRSASVEIEKYIPVGGGLGGGSSDAAAVLRWGGELDLDRAANLGGDVPFCLVGGRALVSGIGEVVDPMPFERLTFTLVVPDFSVNTAEVYRAFDECGAGSIHGHHRNDLRRAARMVAPALSSLMDELERRTGSAPSLAGSGSTLFYEGNMKDVGLDEHVVLEGERLTVIEVETVPPRWDGRQE